MSSPGRMEFSTDIVCIMFQVSSLIWMIVPVELETSCPPFSAAASEMRLTSPMMLYAEFEAVVSETVAEVEVVPPVRAARIEVRSRPLVDAVPPPRRPLKSELRAFPPRRPDRPDSRSAEPVDAVLPSTLIPAPL